MFVLVRLPRHLVELARLVQFRYRRPVDLQISEGCLVGVAFCQRTAGKVKVVGGAQDEDPVATRARQSSIVSGSGHRQQHRQGGRGRWRALTPERDQAPCTPTRQHCRNKSIQHVCRASSEELPWRHPSRAAESATARAVVLLQNHLHHCSTMTTGRERASTYGAMMVLAPGTGSCPTPSMLSGTCSSHCSSWAESAPGESMYHDPAWVADLLVKTICWWVARDVCRPLER